MTSVLGFSVSYTSDLSLAKRGANFPTIWIIDSSLLFCSVFPMYTHFHIYFLHPFLFNFLCLFNLLYSIILSNLSLLSLLHFPRLPSLSFHIFFSSRFLFILFPPFCFCFLLLGSHPIYLQSIPTLLSSSFSFLSISIPIWVVLALLSQNLLEQSRLIKMKCFKFFKDKSNSRRGKSAPELNDRRKSSESDKGKTNRTTKSTGSLPSRSIPEMYREKEHNLRVFSFTELRMATNNFDRLFKIGEGGFGSVYKGTIRDPNGQGEPLLVAIKKLNKRGMQVYTANPFILFFPPKEKI